jgi:DNA-binding NarL/FixJ family response regulator
MTLRDSGAQMLRVLLVDDHAIVREGYRSLLQGQDDIQVVAEAQTSDEAYAKFQALLPDVVVVDLSLQGSGGLEVISRIRQFDPAARLLVFTMHLNTIFAVQAFRAGATGYVTKSSPPQMLVQAVRDARAGRAAISPDIASALARERTSPEASQLDRLSPREFEILRLRLQLMSMEQIAESLHVSAKTVGNLYYQTKAKLGVQSDIELVLLAIRAGLVRPLLP